MDHHPVDGMKNMTVQTQTSNMNLPRRAGPSCSSSSGGTAWWRAPRSAARTATAPHPRRRSPPWPAVSAATWPTWTLLGRPEGLPCLQGGLKRSLSDELNECCKRCSKMIKLGNAADLGIFCCVLCINPVGPPYRTVRLTTSLPLWVKLCTVDPKYRSQLQCA